jgi:hypothetical protein
MPETNPQGVVDTSLRDSDATADTATHLVQSGILDQVMGFDEEDSPSGPEEAEKKEIEPEQAQEEDSEEESTEDADEDPDTEEPETEAEEEIEEVEEPVYTVKANGKTIQVTLDELTSGYQRQSDYTQKTQELANARKQAEADYQAMALERQQYQQGLQQFNEILSKQEAQYDQIDWNALAEEDPTQYLIQKEEQRALKEERQQVDAENARLRAIQGQEVQKRHQEMLQHEWQQLENVFPDWKVPEKREKLSNSWEQYAVSQGYTPEDVKAISDHRALKILNKAMMYDKIQKASVKKGKVVKVPKTVKPGATPETGSKQSGRLKQKINSLRQTGSVDAAASLFFDLDL